MEYLTLQDLPHRHFTAPESRMHPAGDAPRNHASLTRMAAVCSDLKEAPSSSPRLAPSPIILPLPASLPATSPIHPPLPFSTPAPAPIALPLRSAPPPIKLPLPFAPPPPAPFILPPPRWERKRKSPWDPVPLEPAPRSTLHPSLPVPLQLAPLLSQDGKVNSAGQPHDMRNSPPFQPGEQRPAKQEGLPSFSEVSQVDGAHPQTRPSH